MDLVNSVTQNSNNRNVTMENQANGELDDTKDNNVHVDNDNGIWLGSENQRDSPDQQMSTSESAHEETMTSQASFTPRSEALSPLSSSEMAPIKTSSADSKANQVPEYLRAIGMDPRKFWPKKYRFSREKPPGQHNPLTIAQRNFYETNGYIVFDDCASKKLLENIRSQYKESPSMVSEFLLEKLLMKNNKLLQYVRCFCDERLMLMTHRLLDSFQSDDSLLRDLIDNKQQQRQLLFRDWMYLPFRPIDKVCCAITAIEPLEHVLLVVPGTHRIGQCTISSTLDNVSAAYDSSQEKRYQSREIFECSPERLSTLVDKSKKGFKYVNLKPGQTLFYHPGLIHGFSQDLINFRKSQLASIAYYAAADCEYIDLRKSAPSLLQQHQQANDNQDQARQIIPISLAHFESDKNPIDYTSWLDKPRLISNSRANL